LAEEPVPVPIDIPRREPLEPIATSLGLAAAGMLDYLIGVIDREDRLESGTGAWRSGFAAEEGAAAEAVRSSVLRQLRLATDADNFAVLEALADAQGMSAADLAAQLGIGRLPLAERISDLVSAGLVVKLPEVDQVRSTEAGRMLVSLIADAVAAGARDLRRRGG
jgi:biotin operon repressor